VHLDAPPAHPLKNMSSRAASLVFVPRNVFVFSGNQGTACPPGPRVAQRTKSNKRLLARNEKIIFYGAFTNIFGVYPM
jgi:hypothetical protein